MKLESAHVLYTLPIHLSLILACGISSIPDKSIDNNPQLPEYNNAIYILEGGGVIDITHNKCIITLGMNKIFVDSTLGNPDSCNDLNMCIYHYESETYKITYQLQKTTEIEVISNRASCFTLENDEYKWGAKSNDSILRVKALYGIGRESLGRIYFDSLGIGFSIDPIFSKKIESFVIFKGKSTGHTSFLCDDIKDLYISEWVVGIERDGAAGIGLLKDKKEIENILGPSNDSINHYKRYFGNNIEYCIHYDLKDTVKRVVFKADKFLTVSEFQRWPSHNISERTTKLQLLQKMGPPSRTKADTLYYDFQRAGFILDSVNDRIAGVLIFYPEIEIKAVTIESVLDQDSDGCPSQFNIKLHSNLYNGVDSLYLNFYYKPINNVQWKYAGEIPFVLTANNNVNNNEFRLLEGIDTGYYDLKLCIYYRMFGIDSVIHEKVAIDTIIPKIWQENNKFDRISNNYSVYTWVDNEIDYDEDGFDSKFTIYIDVDIKSGNEQVLITLDQYDDSTLQWKKFYAWDTPLEITGTTDADLTGLTIHCKSPSLKSYRINVFSDDGVLLARSFESNILCESSESDSL